MTAETHRKDALRAPAACAGLLIVATLVLVVFAQMNGISKTGRSMGPVADGRELRFEDLANGGISVIDVISSEQIDLIEPGGGGFVRGALRGLARERRRRGIGSELPFRLVKWEDGGMSMIDPATDQKIDLEAFGATNFQAFARLLTLRRTTQ